MAGQRVVLEFQSGTRAGQTVAFEDQTVCILGRAPDCGLVIMDPNISRYHCLLEAAPPKVAVRDLSSLNGTFVNDILVGKRTGDSKEASGQRELRDGDVLRLASSCRIRVRIEGAEARPEPPKVLPPRPSEKELIPGYRLVRQIGQGSMGTVSLVEDSAAGRRLALKMIREDLKDNPDARDFFQREADTGSQLFHPNVARQYGAGEFEGKLYLLTEYYPLGTLDAYLSRNPVSIRDLARLGVQILMGLDYIHQAPLTLRQEDGRMGTFRGVVHRDLKPGNLFVAEENGRLMIKIADFGLSTPRDLQRTETFIGQVRGTYGFMPRQQVLNAGSSAAGIDVWAAAATIFYLLTGRYPRDLDKGDPVRCILTQAAVPIRTYRPEIPKVLADIIDNALRDSPDFSVSTAEELSRQLDMAIDWM